MLSLFEDDDATKLICKGSIVIVIIAVISAVVGLILLFALLMASIRTIPYNHIGLAHNRLTGEMNYNRIYKPGRYLILITKHFITYPSSWQPISREVYTRTKDGVFIDIPITVHYQILDFFELHKRFGPYGFKEFYASEVLQQVCNAVAEFNAIQLQQERRSFTQVLSQRLVDTFQSLYSNITYVAVGNMHLSERFESSIEDKLIAQQEVLRYELQRDVDLVYKDIDIYNATASGIIFAINATRDSRIQLIRQNTNSNITKLQAVAYTDAFQNTGSRLKLTPSDLLSYIYLSTIQNIQAQNTIFIVPPSRTSNTTNG